VRNTGADPNGRSECGTPALVKAIGGGLSPAVIAKLLAAKADVTAHDPSDSTALHAAVRAGNVEIVKALLAAGADVNAAPGNCETPIQTARYAGASEEIVDTLHAAGAKE
jgi:ankyrin repeat protein